MRFPFVLLLITYLKSLYAAEDILFFTIFDYFFNTNDLRLHKTFFHRYTGLSFETDCKDCKNVSLNVSGVRNGQLFSNRIYMSKDKERMDAWECPEPIPLWIANEKENVSVTHFSSIRDEKISTTAVFRPVYRECLPLEVKESQCEMGICISKLPLTGNQWQHCQNLTSQDCDLAHKNAIRSRTSVVCTKSQSYPTTCHAMVDYLFANKPPPGAPPLFEVDTLNGTDNDFCTTNKQFYLTVKFKSDDTRFVPLGSSVTLSDKSRLRYHCPKGADYTYTVLLDGKSDEDDICDSDGHIEIRMKGDCVTLQTIAVNIVAKNAERTIHTYANVVCHTGHPLNTVPDIDANKMCKDNVVHSARCRLDVKKQTFYDSVEFEPIHFQWTLNDTIDMTQSAVNHVGYSILRINSTGTYRCRITLKYISNPLRYKQSNWTYFYFEAEERYDSFCSTDDIVGGTGNPLENVSSKDEDDQDPDSMLIHIVIALVVFIVAIAIIVVSVTMYIRWKNSRKLQYILGDVSTSRTSRTSSMNPSFDKTAHSSPKSSKSGKSKKSAAKSKAKKNVKPGNSEKMAGSIS